MSQAQKKPTEVPRQLNARFSQQRHPALERFLALDPRQLRVLVIKAAPGTGRNWFARSWIGAEPGEIHDWSSSAKHEVIQIETLADKLETDATLRVAILLSPDAPVLELTDRLACLVAGPTDLLLTRNEIQQLLGTYLEGGVCANDRDTASMAKEIHGLCGGWLGAVQVLIEDLRNHEAARRIIRESLAEWLKPNQRAAQLAEVAFLPAFTDGSVAAFYAEYSTSTQSLADLAEQGLVQQDGANGWMMPTLVRWSLQERARLSGRERVGMLETAGIQALAGTHHLEHAVDAAAEHRFWSALQNILLERWVDVFITNPRKLAAMAAKVPKFISDQSGYMWVGLRVLSAAGSDGMVLPFPSVAPDYANDRMAQQIHQQRDALYRKP